MDLTRRIMGVRRLRFGDFPREEVPMRAFSVLSVALFSSWAAAMTLDDLTVGKTVHGPGLDLESLKGKVVLVEFWGTH